MNMVMMYDHDEHYLGDHVEGGCPPLFLVPVDSQLQAPTHSASCDGGEKESQNGAPQYCQTAECQGQGQELCFPGAGERQGQELS